jgi:hypothetical protein
MSHSVAEWYYGTKRHYETEMDEPGMHHKHHAFRHDIDISNRTVPTMNEMMITPSTMPNDAQFLHALRTLCFHSVDSPHSEVMNSWGRDAHVMAELSRCIHYISNALHTNGWRIYNCEKMRLALHRFT